MLEFNQIQRDIGVDPHAAQATCMAAPRQAGRIAARLSAAHVALVAAVSCGVASAHTFADKPTPEVVMVGQSALAAFQCSALATFGGNQTEQARLFKYGYAEGVHFLTAIKSTPLNEQEVRNTAPGLARHLGLMQGPSLDFMLGRLYSAAEGELRTSLDSSVKPIVAAMNLKSRAETEFANRNCQMIGRNSTETTADASARSRKPDAGSTPSVFWQKIDLDVIRTKLDVARSGR